MPAGLVPLSGQGLRVDEVHLGHLQGAFGVRGELKVYLFHPGSELLRRPRAVVLVEPQGARWSGRLVVRPGAGKRLLGRLDGLDDRDVAESMAGWQLAIDARELPPPGEGEVYVRDLIGAPVRIGGAEVGRVEDVQETAGGDVLVVRAGKDLHFVPMVKAWVLGLSREGVDLAPGAFDEP